MAAPSKGKRPKPQQRVRDPNQRIEFDAEDFEVLDLALDQVPELRICAGIVKAARASKLRYPVKSHSELERLLPAKEVVVEGHLLRSGLITRYMPKEFYPIHDERELITRCYIGLIRCREDLAWAARAPAYATSLLKELAETSESKGQG
jgi:hypothetical protein